MEILWQDLQFGARMLRRSPGLVAAVVLTLALGIGLNASVFSLLYSLALRPLPVKNPGNVVNMYQEIGGKHSRGVHGTPYMVSFPEFANYREQNHVFRDLAAYAPIALSMSGVDGPTPGLLVTCTYFEVLEADWALGRGFAKDDCRAAGSNAVAVLNYGLWLRRYGGDPSAIGKALIINRQVVTIIGVAGRDFVGTELQPPDVWIPITLQPQLLADSSEWGTRDWLGLKNVGWLNTVGRLKPGVSHKQAEADLTVIAQQADLEYPGRRTTVSVNAGAYLNNPEWRSVGALVAAAVLGIAGFILLLACTNVMNLLLARGAARQQEVGVRLALGASRNRLVRQFLTETVLLALPGGAAGLMVASWLPPLLVHTIPEMPAAPQLNLTPDFTIVAYTFLASLMAAGVAGLAPALQATRLDVQAALKDEGAPMLRRLSRSRLRNALVAAQVAGCVVLLVGAGLLVRGLQRAEKLDPGFATKNVVIVSFDLEQKGYDEPRAAAFLREAHDRLATLPGVQGVALSGVLPTVTGCLSGVTIPGRKIEGDSLVLCNVVSGDYFQTMGIPLLRGRTFTEQEAKGAQPAPAVISTAMARKYWPEGDRLDKRFAVRDTQYRVVGIVPDAQNLHLGEVDGAFFYAAHDPQMTMDTKIFVRTARSPGIVLGLIPQVVHQIDSNVMVSTDTFEQVLTRGLGPSRIMATLVGVLGGLAMALAVVGVSGVVAYAANQRLREIGVRIAWERGKVTYWLCWPGKGPRPWELDWRLGWRWQLEVHSCFPRRRCFSD
ncbi:MAG TPA: ABC transporter permease [Candidatus Acidoferrales bacterium]|nr:ABC transporter permease [Candidatus Acidoferrales bacterium]